MANPYARAFAPAAAAPPVSHPQRGVLPDGPAFLQLLSWEVRRGARYRRTFTLLRVGLDAARPGADRGPATDEAVAHIVHDCLRDVDVLARLEPGEFALLLPETSVSLVSPVLERLTEALSAAAAAQAWPVSFSVGAVTWKEADVTPDYLLERAGELLSHARRDSARVVEHEVLV